MYTNCTIQISIRYQSKFTELPTDDVESTEVILEGVISPILAELFGGTLLVDDVTVQRFELKQKCDDDLIYLA